MACLTTILQFKVLQPQHLEAELELEETNPSLTACQLSPCASNPTQPSWIDFKLNHLVPNKHSRPSPIS